MVWAALSAKEKSKIAVLTGKQASEYYVYTLSKFLLLFAHLYYGTNYIFQHDNASIDTSGLTTEFVLRASSEGDENGQHVRFI